MTGTDWARPGRELKPIDPAEALYLIRDGRKLTGICATLSVGAGRVSELRAIGEAAGLVYDPGAGRMSERGGVVLTVVPEEDPEEVLAELRRLFTSAGDLAWQDEALCAETDPEAFFPDKGGSTREAKKVCRACDVRADCLGYALDHDERFGIWGGLSERERRRMKREAIAA